MPITFYLLVSSCMRRKPLFKQLLWPFVEFFLAAKWNSLPTGKPQRGARTGHEQACRLGKMTYWRFPSFTLKVRLLLCDVSPHWPASLNAWVSKILVQFQKSTTLLDCTAYFRRAFCPHVIRLISGISERLTIVGNYFTHILSLLKQAHRAIIFKVWSLVW